MGTKRTYWEMEEDVDTSHLIAKLHRLHPGAPRRICTPRSTLSYSHISKAPHSTENHNKGNTHTQVNMHTRENVAWLDL